MARLSVVIPAFNEEELLPATLTALLPQARTAGAEVLVVDNASTDRTAQVARTAGVRVVFEPRRGYVHALRRGFTEVSGDIVAVTDADTIVDPDWIPRIAAHFGEPDVVGVTGPIRFAGHPLATAIRSLLPRELWGANMAVRRSAYTAAGGLDPSTNLASDVHLHRRIVRHGRVAYDPKLRVTTSARRYQADPVRQALRYAVNYAGMRLTGRPVYWSFDPVRLDAAAIRRRTVRRRWAAAGIALAGLFLAWSAWPTSTVLGQILVRGHTHRRVVALTFDDGPNGAATRTIVGILTRGGVRATFFEVGRSVAADPATTRFVAQAGFPIGNHSWDHAFDLPVLPPHRIEAEIAQTQIAIASATGTAPTLFRPPHGYRSPALLYAADRHHLRTVDWSVDPGDYLTANPRTIERKVITDVRPGDIVLLHDGLQDGPFARKLRNRAATIAALPVIIEQLRAKGYTFVTIPELQALSTRPRPQPEPGERT